MWRWRQTNRHSSWRPQERRAKPKLAGIHMAAIRFTSHRWHDGAMDSPRTTSGGRGLTSCWIVGHSYIVYAPLIIGCNTLAFEGALDYPAARGQLEARNRGVRRHGVFTSPTAVRLLMRYGDAPLGSVDHSKVERVVCAGEVLNAPAWDWLQNTVLKGRAPVIDHMWQTETGGPVFGNPYGLGMLPIKPGSAGIPLPGIEAEVVDPDGSPCQPSEKGIMVIKRPFPGLIASLWGERERYGRRLLGEHPRLVLHRRRSVLRRRRIRVVRRSSR